MNIKKTTAVISAVNDLSGTAREVTFAPNEPFPFIAGHFVNLFLTHNGITLRRAYSLSSSDRTHERFSVSVRLNPQGAMSPLFWADDIVGTTVEVMGPLGLNTADKLHSKRIFLFGFGVGAGVVKSLAMNVTERDDLESLTIMTGSRTDDDILHKAFFDGLAETDPRVQVAYAVTEPAPNSPHLTGYIQQHLAAHDFNQADVYVCGQGVACDALIATVKATDSAGCTFFVEAFH